ncbi:MAG: ParB/RepB/Spo0J family partition protein [Clostridiaceae bacterium]|jgi:ParB family chromosome partitioning protein|nr:ParB/RepB/Spo0J family partition protein [Clostridiaceae bacterium]
MKKGLGKGLGALISSAEIDDDGIREVRINEIEPNIEQPRKSFSDEKLAKLAESIKQHGVVQPLIVHRQGNGYKLVAGERRWRAARLAGLLTVPVIIRELSSRQVMEIALIENIQREDLNPVEEAEAYERLISEFGMTQEEVSQTVGRSRPAITNSLRLLSLPDKIKSRLISGEISSGHARALLSIESNEMQQKALEEIIRKELSVRETELLAKQLSNPKKPKKVKETDPEYQAIEEKFREVFGTKVRIMNNKKNGKILIEYYSPDELDRIINIIDSISKNSR